MNKSNIEIVERFIDGLAKKNTTQMPLAENVHLISPLTPEKPYNSKKEMVQFLEEKAFPKLPIIGATIEKHIVDGDVVCTLWRLHLEGGTEIPIFDYFLVKDDHIEVVRPYFDPRPLLKFL